MSVISRIVQIRRHTDTPSAMASAFHCERSCDTQNTIRSTLWMRIMELHNRAQQNAQKRQYWPTIPTVVEYRFLHAKKSVGRTHSHPAAGVARVPSATWTKQKPPAASERCRKTLNAFTCVPAPPRRMTLNWKIFHIDALHAACIHNSSAIVMHRRVHKNAIIEANSLNLNEKFTEYNFHSSAFKWIFSGCCAWRITQKSFASITPFMVVMGIASQVNDRCCVKIV